MNNESKDTAMVNLVDEDFLRQKQAERERSREETALEGTLPLLHDRKKDIETIFEEEKIKTALKDVKTLLVSEIEKAVRDIMIVPEYSQKGAAKQEIYVYVGTHWKVLDIQTYYDYIKKACKVIGLSEIYYQDPEFMNKVFEQVAFSVSHHIHTVQPMDGVWINLRNCTVQVESGKLKVESGSKSDVESCSKSLISTHEHRPEDFFLYCLPYDYDPKATCPRWKQFLNEIFDEEEERQKLGEYFGYCLTQNLKLEKMALFYGKGANGKSVTIEVMKKLIGKENVSEVTLSSICYDDERRSLIKNKLVNFSSESAKKIEPSIIKMIVSGESIEYYKNYKGSGIIENPPKLVTSYNELPNTENNYAMQRRMIIFPFNHTVPASKQDPNLEGKLIRELPGILNWVLGNLSNLLKRVNSGSGEDFIYSKACHEALDQYFNDANTVLLFAEQCCKIDDTSNLKLKDAYACYRAYCTSMGETDQKKLKEFKKFMVDWGAKLTLHLSVLYVNVTVDSSIYS